MWTKAADWQLRADVDSVGRRCRRFVVVVLALISAGLAGPSSARGQAGPTRWAAPPIERAVAIREGRSGKPVPFAEFLDALAEADVVFLGETHSDETTHRVELATFEGLLARRNGRVVLAMEMFERDVQRHLDAYLAGEADEATFLAHARPWSNYRAAYRPLVERAKASRRPVIASNFPRPLQRRVAKDGPQALKNLEGDARHQSPAEVLPNSAAYWRRVDNAVRGHAAMAGHGRSDRDRLYSPQSLWDNTMGESCAIALDKYPGDLVLHVNGAFHTDYWDGTVHQLRLRMPKAKIKTVSIEPVANPAVEEIRGAPLADYVVFAESRASDAHNGTWSINVQRECKYRFHLPKGASPDAPVPLLIWLSDDGLTAADGLDLWKDRLGDKVAIAVLEAPYRETQEDLSVGGRWFWSDNFSSDLSALVTAIERMWGYLMRHYPLDAHRVCLAGEGTGATVVVAATLLTDCMDVEGVAFVPGQFAKIKELALPLPEFWGDEKPPHRSLRVVAGKDAGAWWAEELNKYKDIGLKARLVPVNPSPWQQESQAEDLLREVLGLDRRTAVTANMRRYILVEGDSPRARHWARLHARRLTDRDGISVAVVDTLPADNQAVRVPVVVRPEAFAEPHALPRCPGPFGGTTILVLPDTTMPGDLTAWLELAKDDPIAKESRFHRLRVATGDGERSLGRVLTKLQAAGRTNVLVVPVAFCADPAWIRELKRGVRHWEDRMTIHWLPGLGGSKAALTANRLTTRGKESLLRHTLSVKLQPDTHDLLVSASIELPDSLCQAGAEFTLNPALAIRESDPPVRKLKSPADSAARYALETAPANGVLKLVYAGQVDFGLSDQKEEYTRGFRETRGMIRPEGVYLDGDSAWVPKFDDRLIRFRLQIQLPEGWHLISQGKGTSRNDDAQAVWDSAGAMEQVYLVGGPLHRHRDTANGTDIAVYLHERDDTLARKYLDATARYLSMYETLIGPYPYGKFALVENFWETGLGMPSFTLLGPQVIRFPFILHSSYPHEILHNWWGNSVFVDYAQGNWCEGLTAYLADHLIQEQRGMGAEYRRNTLQKYRDYVRQNRDFPLAEFRARHSAATEAVGYGKALMIFHMLRRQLGDDAFRQALRSFYAKQRGRRASFDDLQSAFQGVTEEDLQPLFDQWVRRTGAPALALRDVSVAEAEMGFVLSGSLEQVQKEEPFVLKVPLLVNMQDQQKSFLIDMQQKSQAFRLTVPAPPQLLAVDPMFDIFRHLDPRETPASIGQIFGQPRVLAVLPTSSEDRAVVDRYRQLVEAWRSDEHKIELAADTELKSLPDDRAIWILGRKNSFAKKILSDASKVSLAQSNAALTLNGQAVPLADHSFVVVRRHPRNIQQAMAWLVVDPATAFPGMARKLPHYGKYSFLAFQGQEPTNVVKGQWETTGSPLVVDLRKDQSGNLPSVPSETRRPLAELPPDFSREALMAHVTWLSAPEREGRGLGSRGLDDAAKYITRHMAAAGLTPGGAEGSWLQPFTVAKGPQDGPVEAVNVVGVLPGKRADWRDQSVIVSAHYDHLGRGWPDVHSGDEGKLHPGADDNASGVAVLLEMARHFAAQGGGSRNLVVVAFSAEECGRHGSRYYVDHPRFPLDGIRAVINLDTVGRLFDGKLTVLGTATAREWPHIFRGCGYVTGIDIQDVAQAASGSDQMSFIEKGIPAVQIFTGAHQDYHRPSDTADKVDPAGLVKVAAFATEAVAYLLEREPPLAVQGQEETTRKTPGNGRKVLFGTVPAFDFQGTGVKIDSLVVASPAARAGLRPGDVILRLDKQDIRDLRAFAEFLKTLQPGQEVVVDVLRDGVEVKTRVKVERR